MLKRLLPVILLCGMLLLTACGKDENIITKMPGEDVTGETISTTDITTPDTATSDTEVQLESSVSESTETQTTHPDTSGTPTNSAAGTNDKSTNPPADKTPSQSPSPPATSTPTQPPTSTPPNTPSNSPPTTSTPPTPEYEILGQDYLNGVLKGINDRRAALGLPLAKLDSALSNECLVQAKKMADAGHTFHSEWPTGCEGVSKVPYNFPAELMGDQMCNHVADFTYEATTKIGVAVVKKNNSLFVVVQGTA